MPVEIGLWRVDGRPERISPGTMPLESRLEQLILDDPEILETQLLLIGSQVQTGYGKYIDVLGIDAEGVTHVLELKRDRTPRDVVAQTLDYASWIQQLGNEDIRQIFAKHHPTQNFDEQFALRFDGAPVPDELNSSHVLTIIASDLDSSTERIVAYLNNSHNVPINVMKFRYFTDQGHDYLVRTWLIDEEKSNAASIPDQGRSTRAAWNGRDWYASFGIDNGTRSWEDARNYGFISAGGGEWYSRTLKSLPVDSQVSVYVPRHGYVGIGEVRGKAMRTQEAMLSVDGKEVAFTSLPLVGSYRHPAEGGEEEADEYIVPVRWIETRSLDDAVWRAGMFANQNSACKLRNQFTIDELSKAFQLTELF